MNDSWSTYNYHKTFVVKAGSDASNEANENAAHANGDNDENRKKVDGTVEVNKNLLESFIILNWYYIIGKDPIICICEEESKTNKNQTTDELNQQN